MNTNAWKEKKVPSAQNNEDKTDDDAYELYIIQRATSFNSRTRTTAQHDVVLRFYRVGFCELEERDRRRHGDVQRLDARGFVRPRAIFVAAAFDFCNPRTRSPNVRSQTRAFVSYD